MYLIDKFPACFCSVMQYGALTGWGHIVKVYTVKRSKGQESRWHVNGILFDTGEGFLSFSFFFFDISRQVPRRPLENESLPGLPDPLFNPQKRDAQLPFSYKTPSKCQCTFFHLFSSSVFAEKIFKLKFLEDEHNKVGG